MVFDVDYVDVIIGEVEVNDLATVKIKIEVLKQGVILYLQLLWQVNQQVDQEQAMGLLI